ncbi:MAG: hypothetical protein ACE5FI_03230, partial [Anaerolineales bacterium]
MLAQACGQPGQDTSEGDNCTHDVRAPVYEDLNGDGIRGPDEPGLSGVSTSYNVPDEAPQTSPAADVAGLARIHRSQWGQRCDQNTLLTVEVEPPPGYLPTTPLRYEGLQGRYGFGPRP